MFAARIVVIFGIALLPCATTGCGSVRGTGKPLIQQEARKPERAGGTASNAEKRSEQPAPAPQRAR